MRNEELKRNITKGIFTFILVMVAVTTILPFLWMISASLKFETDVFTYPVQWIPKKFNAVANYKEIWAGNYNFALFYWNTIKITVIATVLQVTFSAMAGYAFAKVEFRFKNVIFMCLIGALMIPDQVILVPRFLLSRWFGLYDTHAIIIILLSFSVYGMFLMRQYMVTIPDALSESAKIDGATHLNIFLNIVLPMSKPIVATLAILKFVWTWNDYQTPLIFLKSRSLYTIQLGIRQFASESGTFYSLQMAAAVCTIIPLLIVFLSGQKYIIEGMAAGAVKG